MGMAMANVAPAAIPMGTWVWMRRPSGACTCKKEPLAAPGGTVTCSMREGCIEGCGRASLWPFEDGGLVWAIALRLKWTREALRSQLRTCERTGQRGSSERDGAAPLQAARGERFCRGMQKDAAVRVLQAGAAKRREMMRRISHASGLRGSLGRAQSGWCAALANRRTRPAGGSACDALHARSV